ncbi:MAG TPA: phospholipase D-like domain-containing protein, partial [bacterium]|nr:phospholipase D-like domain-containing protein [bacterium]
KKSSILHAKFAIIDGNCVFVGSANFTDSSLGWDSNNILFIDDKEIADFFSRNFMHLWLNLSLSDCYFLKKDYIEIYFSPLSDCLSIINNHIKQARQMIRFAMFSFTLDAIGQEICRAGLKGIKTYGIFEKSQNPVSNEYYFLKKLPFIHIKRDCFVKNIHDKFLIIDDNIVLTGSFNYTQSARKNIETLIVLRNNCLVSQYVKRWKHLWLWY